MPRSGPGADARQPDCYDCLVVGSFAGLAAALRLVRARRRAPVIDGAAAGIGVHLSLVRAEAAEVRQL